MLISSVPAGKQDDIEIWTSERWKAHIVKVDNISNGVIYTHPATPWYTYEATAEKPFGVFDVQNAYEFINENNEWYYDKYDTVLFYKSSIDPNTLDIVFPVLQNIINAEDLNNVTFAGLTFKHATWLKTNEIGYFANQGSIYLENLNDHTISHANISFSACNNVSILSNNFEHLGAEALCFDRGSTNNFIKYNSFEDVAGTAIRIGNGHDFNPSFNGTSGNIITGNNIANVANEYRAHCGIWLGYVNNNKVNYNKLSHLPYTGISSGYPPLGVTTALGGNIIEHNEIADCMMDLQDGGAIYNIGNNNAQSYIRYNKICGLSKHDTHGIYLDQYSSNILVTDNYGDISSPTTPVFVHVVAGTEMSDNQFNNNNFDGACNNNNWINRPTYKPEYHTASEDTGDLGVRFIDVNHDGLKDMVYFRWISSDNIQRGVYLNECDQWGPRLEDHPYCLPYHVYVDGLGDMGVQFVDFDNDGYEDMLYSRYNYPEQSKAYRNTGTGWEYRSEYNPPIPMYADGIGDLGVRFIDVNADNLPDLIYSRWLNSSNQHRRVYLNTGNGWTQTTDPAFFIPGEIMFSADGIGDLGVQLVDLNGDGAKDLLYWRWGYERGAYLNNNLSTGGWTLAPDYTPPYPIFTNSYGVLGVKFIDVDHSGSIDMIVNREITTTSKDVGSWLNINGSWVPGGTYYAPPMPTFKDWQIDGRDQGVLAVDLNGDGYEDLVQGYWAATPNENIPIGGNYSVVSNAYYRAFFNNSNTYANCDGNSSGRISMVDSFGSEPNEQKKEIYEENLRIYPNPFSDELEIFITTESTLSIKDFAGRKIYDLKANEGIISLNTSGLDPGIYIVCITNDEETIFKKIIKK